MRRRSGRRWLAIAAVVAAIAIGWGGPPSLADQPGSVVAASVATASPLRARIEIIDKTERTLRDKIRARSGQLRARVRTLYKLSRSGWAPLWLDSGERAALLRRRGFAARLLQRDLREIQILEGELESVERNRARYETAPTSAVGPVNGSLSRPVSGRIVTEFGRYSGRKTGTQLMSRGIEFAATTGESVESPLPSVVEYAGPLRHLGQVVVLRGDQRTRVVVGRLAELAVKAGDEVGAGAVLGTAAGRRVYLEVRLGTGPGGLPLDPQPLLAD